jgi:hypothetical protein
VGLPSASTAHPSGSDEPHATASRTKTKESRDDVRPERQMVDRDSGTESKAHG